MARLDRKVLYQCHTKCDNTTQALEFDLNYISVYLKIILKY